MARARKKTTEPDDQKQRLADAHAAREGDEEASAPAEEPSRRRASGKPKGDAAKPRRAKTSRAEPEKSSANSRATPPSSRSKSSSPVLRGMDDEESEPLDLGTRSSGEIDADREADSAPPPLERIVEAMLFVGGPPLTAVRACEILRGVTAEQFLASIRDLNRAYRRQNRPYQIAPQGQGFVLALRSRFRPVLERLFGGVREARLSTSAVDVLSLVAYRQPVTRAEIDSIRGADSASLLRQLVRRGLVHVIYRGDAEQKEVSYGTTPRFLEMFGLASLDDLPRTQDAQQL